MEVGHGIEFVGLSIYHLYIDVICWRNSLTLQVRREIYLLSSPLSQYAYGIKNYGEHDIFVFLDSAHASNLPWTHLHLPHNFIAQEKLIAQYVKTHFPHFYRLSFFSRLATSLSLLPILMANFNTSNSRFIVSARKAQFPQEEKS